MLLGRPPDDLLALHVELLDGPGDRAEGYDVWILLHDAHSRQLNQVLVNNPRRLRFET